MTTAAARPASLLPTLPGRFYADPALFALEQERIFETQWLAVARTADLAGPGAFQTAGAGRESVVLVRGRDGVLRAFLNVCRHRGARLCEQPAGQVARTLQCPYHAWTYALDGRLAAAPNLSRMDDIDRAAYGLVPVHLTEWLGYAWICLAASPPDFAAAVQAAVAERLGGDGAIDAWSLGTLAVGRRVTYDVRANWKLIIENFMECYHCATIHPELTEVIPEFAGGYAAQYYTGYGAAFGDDVQGFTVDGTGGFPALGGLGADRDRRYYAVTVRPQVFINLVSDHVIFHRMTPVAADRTIVDCDWLYAPSVIAGGADIGQSAELFHRVNQQDFAACERCQPGMSSRLYAGGGVLVPSEHHIAGFHAWVTEALGDAVT
ncbi:MAG: aromatic ring-hydroxylating dioxygenase subunit alpha [Streptosporangiales bacterium]|nr:aromatic ring-hydroxylating dioxygenase subunit alpha [Streptosporangiales bacterium]